MPVVASKNFCRRPVGVPAYFERVFSLLPCQHVVSYWTKSDTVQEENVKFWTERIDALKMAFRFSDEELAEKLGLSRQTLHTIRTTGVASQKSARLFEMVEQQAPLRSQPQGEETPTRPKVWDLAEVEHRRWKDERATYGTREKIKVSPAELRALASSLIKDVEALLQRARELEKMMKEQEP